MICVAISLGISACGQCLITGRVRDPKGRPVAGVSISIRNSYDGATSDSSGSYQFITNEKDSQVLVVSSVGYSSQALPVNANRAKINSRYHYQRRA